MAVYSIADVTTIFTSAAATAELRTSATDRARLFQWTTGLDATATAFRLGLGRPAAIGVTPTSPVTWLAEDPGDQAGTVQLVTVGWGTAPTAPVNFFRLFRFAFALGVHWEFPRGLVIAASSSLVLWNQQLAVATNIFAWGEE